jgi:hypothetical protein
MHDFHEALHDFEQALHDLPFIGTKKTGRAGRIGVFLNRSLSPAEGYVPFFQDYEPFERAYELFRPSDEPFSRSYVPFAF